MELNKLIRVDSIQDTVPFSILADILSEPVALLRSRDTVRLYTWSSVCRKWPGHLEGSVNVGKASKESNCE